MAASWIKWLRQGTWRRAAGWLLAVALLGLVGYYAIRAWWIEPNAPVRLIVYAFSTQEEVFTQGIFPAFEAAWEAETGRDLAIEGVFEASGALAAQINMGAPADVAVFSNAEHVDWLRIGKRVQEDSTPVIVGCTPMIIAVRPGNPFHISDYAGLAQQGIRLLHADPRSSGAGAWSLLSEYGDAYFATGDQAVATDQLIAVWRNVQILVPSARAAMRLFELGTGDALVTYEQDALRAEERKAEIEIVIPARTVVAQHAAIIVDTNVTRTEKAAAESFVHFLSSDAGQSILEGYYLRPADCRSNLFPLLAQPFTAEDLGGWSRASAQLVQGVWQEEIEPGLDLEPLQILTRTGER
jgi:sulfate transport system substrate-binding protein